MLQTIEGIFSNGQVIFNETPPLKEKVKVIVTFMEDELVQKKPKKRKLGMFDGLIKVPYDFI